MTGLVEYRWPVVMHRVNRDHGYRMFSALCFAWPLFHQGGWQVAPLLTVSGFGRRLSGPALLRIRGVADPRILTALDGETLSMGTHGDVRVRPGTEAPCRPAPTLRARAVFIKSAKGPEDFARKVASQLADRLGRVPTFDVGSPCSAVIARATVHGYEVTVGGLTEAESMTLQARGLGGKRSMGGGVFLPTGKRARVALVGVQP